ncbi:MAG: hypothetical protein M3432_01080 [Chloroflexota bacterium]|nr:hypothetical protein [Chloroflexota bacterium]
MGASSDGAAFGVPDAGVSEGAWDGSADMRLGDIGVALGDPEQPAIRAATRHKVNVRVERRAIGRVTRRLARRISRSR